MKWSRVRDGIAATGADGCVYRIRRDPLRVEVITPEGEVIEPLQGHTIPWRDEAEAKRWADECDAMRRQ